MSVGDGHGECGGFLFAYLLFELFAEEAESDGGLGGGSGFGDDDDAEAAATEIFLKFEEIVLADVLTGEEDVAALVLVCGEAVAEGFDDGFCAEVRAADAYADNGVAFFAEMFGGGDDVVDEIFGGACWEVDPAEEVVSGAGAVVYFVEG